mmetsp:Transcript_29782/g.80069  ORF Transcript_29782/g.80069 Transcript_29782/m.80069 type:complete len:210 (-) Transcript_29782:548-1177(-)
MRSTKGVITSAEATRESMLHAALQAHLASSASPVRRPRSITGTRIARESDPSALQKVMSMRASRALVVILSGCVMAAMKRGSSFTVSGVRTSPQASARATVAASCTCTLVSERASITAGMRSGISSSRPSGFSALILERSWSAATLVFHLLDSRPEYSVAVHWRMARPAAVWPRALAASPAPDLTSSLASSMPSSSMGMKGPTAQASTA